MTSISTTTKAAHHMEGIFLLNVIVCQAGCGRPAGTCRQRWGVAVSGECRPPDISSSWHCRWYLIPQPQERWSFHLDTSRRWASYLLCRPGGGQGEEWTPSKCWPLPRSGHPPAACWQRWGTADPWESSTYLESWTSPCQWYPSCQPREWWSSLLASQLHRFACFPEGQSWTHARCHNASVRLSSSCTPPKKSRCCS